jgi:UPF0716 protein FxsA
MRLLFLLFIILPIAELMLLFKVGQAIGVLPTIALVLFTATAGVRILKHQSRATMQRAQQRLQGGELPGTEILEGFLISIGGALLLTPGFITDVFAIVLLLPFTRRPLVQYLFKTGGMSTFGSMPGGFTFTRFGGGWPPHGGKGQKDVFEGEFTKEDPLNPSLRAPDGQNRP